MKFKIFICSFDESKNTQLQLITFDVLKNSVTIISEDFQYYLQRHLRPAHHPIQHLQASGEQVALHHGGLCHQGQRTWSAF